MTINAYNTGPGRMIQARRQLNTTDISKIIKHFKGAGYGKDSKNYFPEFLAALHIYENKEQFFGELKINEPEEFEFVALPGDMNIHELVRKSGVPKRIIAQMNLGLKPSVIHGSKNLPKGYLLKIPMESKQNILLAMSELYKEIRFATHHIVQKGDSLKRIAKMYDIKKEDLVSLNKFMPKQKLKAGDVVQLPSRGSFSAMVNDSEDLVVPDKLNSPVF